MENTYAIVSKTWLPDDIKLDSAVNEKYVPGEYIVPVNSGGAIYEHEIDGIYRN